MNTIKHMLLLAALILGFGSQAQNKQKQKTKTNIYPQSFSIGVDELDRLMNTDARNVLSFPKNTYINQSTVELNTKNGDMHFIKLKLAYFAKSYLLIQENGVYSTVVFIMSDDKSVFYKGKRSKDGLNMTKCAEDDIVSE